MRIYGYWRSSSSYRLRLAMAFKGLSYESVPVHLVRDGGEHLKPDYRKLNPAARVPGLVLDDGRVLTQSLAIIEWLEEQYPAPSLLPGDAFERAHIRAAAQEIAIDAQPLHNSGVLAMLESDFGANQEQKAHWVRHWVERSCAIVEALSIRQGAAGPFLFGEAATLADICLEPHLYTADRWGLSLDPFPRLRSARAALQALPGISDAHPDRQPDAG